jgi:hypothetical protein
MKKGYKPAWLVHQLLLINARREIIREVIKIKGYKEGWFENTVRFLNQKEKKLMDFE